MYFDNSVYGFIDDADEARAVRTWLKRSQLRVEASDEVNLGEAIRAPDPKVRASRVKTILLVASGPTYPSDLVVSDEFLREVRRCRPEWIKTYPSLASKEAYLRRRRARLSNWIKQNPGTLPDTARIYFPVLGKVIGENSAAQKARRSGQLKHLRRRFIVTLPELVQVFESYSELEQYARYQAEIDWRYQLTEPKTPAAENDWLLPHLDHNAMSVESEWHKFWFRDASLAAMPAVHVQALTEYFQADRRITSGNTFDRIHAAYLATHEVIVTAVLYVITIKVSKDALWRL
jgi:hypothetical protein